MNIVNLHYSVAEYWQNDHLAKAFFYCIFPYHVLRLQRFQRVQNCAAHVVRRTRKHEHITPVLQRLHWLRPICKVLIFVYSAMNGLALDCFAGSFNRRHPNHQLRSLLSVPVSQAVAHCVRRFVAASANLWNRFPDSVMRAKTRPQYRTL